MLREIRYKDNVDIRLMSCGNTKAEDEPEELCMKIISLPMQYISYLVVIWL